MQTSFKKTSSSRFNGLTIGKVYNVYPEANMVDVLLFDGTRLKDVQLMVPYASSNVGILNIPLPKYDQDMLDKDAPLSQAKQSETDVFVVIGFLGGSIIRPIGLGFLFPENNEVLCAKSDNDGNSNGGMYLFKHSSNVHTIIDKDGQIELEHPSGLLIKIGKYDSDKEPDEQQTVLSNWDKDIRAFKTGNPLSDNDEKSDAPWVHMYHPSGTYVTIDNDGNAKIYVVGDVTETVEGDVDRTIKGNVTEEIDGTFEQTVKKKVTQTFEDELDTTVTKKVTQTFEDELETTVSGDVTETFQGDVTETMQADLMRTVSGTETDDVTGTWQRTSSASIVDTAPTINHT